MRTVSNRAQSEPGCSSFNAFRISVTTSTLLAAHATINAVRPSLCKASSSTEPSYTPVHRRTFRGAVIAFKTFAEPMRCFHAAMMAAHTGPRDTWCSGIELSCTHIDAVNRAVRSARAQAGTTTTHPVVPQVAQVVDHCIGVLRVVALCHHRHRQQPLVLPHQRL